MSGAGYAGVVSVWKNWLSGDMYYSSVGADFHATATSYTLVAGQIGFSFHKGYSFGRTYVYAQAASYTGFCVDAQRTQRQVAVNFLL